MYYFMCRGGFVCASVYHMSAVYASYLQKPGGCAQVPLDWNYKWLWGTMSCQRTANVPKFWAAPGLTSTFTQIFLPLHQCWHYRDEPPCHLQSSHALQYKVSVGLSLGGKDSKWISLFRNWICLLSLCPCIPKYHIALWGSEQFLEFPLSGPEI